jgi:hypothetical protein
VLFASYALFLGIAALALVANPEHWSRYTQLAVRAVTGVVALAAGGVATLLLTGGFGDTHTTEARLLLGAIAAGSVLYLGGLSLWRGPLPFALRVTGWILLVVPALVPSTLSLALPLLATLSLAISPVRSVDSKNQPLKPASESS